MSVLVEGIRAALRDELYLAPALAGRADLALALRRARSRRRMRTGGALAILSPREREVFRQLGISPMTVETHRAHIMRKLQAHSLPDLVRFAARHELLVG